MERYQIHDLEQLSGIKAHTIRIWEKRYGLIQPHRTSTNIRYYDDAQVRKLLNVATLLEQGHKISKVADMSENEIRNLIKTIQEQSPADTVSNAFINDLIRAMLSFDEIAFEKLFSAVVTRLGMYKAVTTVFYPFLHKTGILWSSDEASPAQEHFASSIIRRKLLSATDGLPPASRTDKKFLLFLPPDEWHEIGLLFSDYVMRANGYPTVYLGQNMPFRQLEFTIKKTKPTHLFVFFVSGNHQGDSMKSLIQLLHANKNLKCIVSGNSLLLKIFEKEKAVRILQSPDEFLKIL